MTQAVCTAQAFSTATATAASALARLLTLTGILSIVAHSIHSKVSAEAVTLL